MGFLGTRDTAAADVRAGVTLGVESIPDGRASGHRGGLRGAAAPVLETQLPQATASSTGSVVILHLRGKQELGSTFIAVVRRYHAQLDAAGSRLYLAGVSDRVRRQLDATRATDELGQDAVFLATPAVHESVQAAVARAEDWVREQR